MFRTTESRDGLGDLDPSALLQMAPALVPMAGKAASGAGKVVGGAYKGLRGALGRHKTAYDVVIPPWYTRPVVMLGGGVVVLGLAALFLRRS